MSWRRIVVGVDFSEASLAAARWVANEFAPDANLILVHVMSTPGVPSYVPSEFTSSDGAAVPSAPYGGLRGLADLVGGSRCRIRVLSGQPAVALVQVANEVGADLICVGRGRRRRGSARFGATTSQRLLTRNPLPTLIVPPTRLITPSLILAAVDDRGGGRRVFDAAGTLSDAHEAHVDVLHVIEQELFDYLIGQDPFDAPGEAQPYGAWASTSGVGAWLRARAHEWIVAEMQEAGAGRNGASVSVQTGDAGQLIIRQARIRNADLIVMGRGGAERRVNGRGSPSVGSTARMVAWAAPCPTLLLPLEPLVLTPSTDRGRHSSSRGGLSSSNSALPNGNLAS